MMMVKFVSSLAVLLALASQVAASGGQVCAREPPFDVALLSVQYAPSVCSSKKCVPHSNEYTIHGMWPNYMNNSFPENCCLEQHLKRKTLDSIMNQMKKSWRNLLAGNDDFHFWSYEWRKHGTCAASSKLRGQLNYFKTALDLFDDLKIPEWLYAAGIKAIRASTGVNVEKLRQALRQGFGKRPQLNCIRGSELPALSELHFCYDPQTLDPIDCPAESGNICRSKTGKIFIPLV